VKDTEYKIYRLSAMCAILGILTFVVPRFFANPEGAFASGANAIVGLLAMLLVTLVPSIYLLAVTLGAYEEISTGCRAAGIGPIIVLALLLVAFFGFLRY
jgi:hypothetical protein